MNPELRELASTFANRTKPIDLSRLLFHQQLRFATDASHYRTAVCSARAGKTTACAASLLDTAALRRGSVSLYLTLSRLNAKRIVWGTLRQFNDEHKFGGEFNETELYIRFPSGSMIYLVGAGDRTEIEKYRGMPLAKVVIDEAQSFPGYLKNLVDEVLAPRLMDFDGSIDLIGTPGPVPNGYFYECTQSKAWSHHAWTVFQNPWIERKSGKTPQQHLEQELLRRGITIEDPVIQREWFGRWCLDLNSLVFRYDVERNAFDTLPAPEPSLDDKWEYVFGLDFGFDDADAIAVLAWHPQFDKLWLVDEWTGPKQNISALTDRVKTYEERYAPLAIVADFGGLGKKIASEISMRLSVELEPADKNRKLEHIEFLNDAMRTGKFYAKADGKFAQDCLLVEWDRTNPQRPKVSERYHSDICDAVLYAYRRALHWLHEPRKKPPAPGTPEYHAALVAAQVKLAEEGLEGMLRRNAEELEVQPGLGNESTWLPPWEPYGG